MGRYLAIAAVLALAASGCKKEAPRDNPGAVPSAPAPAPAPAPTPRTVAPPAAAEADSGISGKVVETMDAGGYTYARLDHGGTDIWVAGPQTKLAVGMALGAMTGQLMSGFRSETLNRTFEQIYFVSNFGGSAPADPHAPAAPAVAVPDEKIAPAKGGQTVAAVITGKAALKGKPVVVRGKVVKLNNGILDRNWIHLRDGTGAAPANDLLVTTKDTTKLGDVIVVRGTVAVDQDFGSGYKYDVLVENATLSAE